MFEKLELTRMAQALARHSGARLATIAGNVANADTPGYKARDVAAFSEAYQASEARMTRPDRKGRLIGAEVAPSLSARLSEPKIIAGAASPNGNAVSLDMEMMKSVEARQSHEMALAVYRSTSSIIRTALGRSN